MEPFIRQECLQLSEIISIFAQNSKTPVLKAAVINEINDHFI